VEYGRGRIVFLEGRQVTQVNSHQTPPRIMFRSAASRTETILSADLIVDSEGQPSAWVSLPTVMTAGSG
jgi:hypothetical protein